jgi:hypothetical protein
LRQTECTMSDTDLKNASATQTKPVTSSWLSKHRILSAVLLRGLWKLRWYHTMLLWLSILAYAWSASPYFMVYVVGMPEPGTAPRYIGTIRVEGEFQFTRNGSKPPKYFIKTDKGETEFHCGYLPYRRLCSLEVASISKPDPNEVYEIGYDPYWGLDYIKYPKRLAKLDDYGSTKAIVSGRYFELKSHLNDLRWLCFLLLGYLVLIWLAYQKSDPNRESYVPYPDAKPYPFEPVTENSDKPALKKSSQSKTRRSFFD